MFFWWICQGESGLPVLHLCHLSSSPHQEFFSFSWLSATRVISSAYLRLLMFLPEILIPACNSSSPAFLMMYSAYKLNKQGDHKQHCHTPFSILNQSVVSYRVLTVASWPTYTFLKRQVRWSVPISLRIFHSLLWSTIRGFSVVYETEVDVFLEFLNFLFHVNMIQWMLTISSLVPLSFLNPVWTSGGFWFT